MNSRLVLTYPRHGPSSVADSQLPWRNGSDVVGSPHAPRRPGCRDVLGAGSSASHAGVIPLTGPGPSKNGSATAEPVHLSPTGGRASFEQTRQTDDRAGQDLRDLSGARS